MQLYNGQIIRRQQTFHRVFSIQNIGYVNNKISDTYDMIGKTHYDNDGKLSLTDAAKQKINTTNIN